jgi:hypothetical protein
LKTVIEQTDIDDLAMQRVKQRTSASPLSLVTGEPHLQLELALCILREFS